MFAQALTALITSGLDPENVPVPRPHDSKAEECNNAAMKAMRVKFPILLPSDRRNDPEGYARARAMLRDNLESLIWMQPGKVLSERVADLLGLLCAEYTWSDADIVAEDPAHPIIDLHAAETGALIAWVLRRHGQWLDEYDPRVSAAACDCLRRRLLKPVFDHDDYPFMESADDHAIVILCDITFTVLMVERSWQRRSHVLKKTLRLLDRYYAKVPNGSVPLEEKLTDACAMSDLSRLLKRLTRGEVDLTRSVPAEAVLDDILSAYIGRDLFWDPCGEGITNNIRGIDIFRLGYMTGDPALRKMGARKYEANRASSRTVTGRILSMEYITAATSETEPAPRLRRAVISDGTMMITRGFGFTAGASSRGLNTSSGDFIFFLEDEPVIAAPAGVLPSVPKIGDFEPIENPNIYACEDNFSEERDLISMDMTENYPVESGLIAYQRTIMLSRKEPGVRLVEAFEFSRPPRSITFRFTSPQRFVSLRVSMRIGNAILSWDGNMTPTVIETEHGQQLQLTLKDPDPRFIVSFGFDVV